MANMVDLVLMIIPVLPLLSMGNGYGWLHGEPLPHGTICMLLDPAGPTLLIFAETAPHERDWRIVRIALDAFGITDIGEPAWFADIDLWEVPLPARHATLK